MDTEARDAAIERQAEMLADRPFSLTALRADTAAYAAKLRDIVEEHAPVADGAILAFGRDPEQRRLARQRRVEEQRARMLVLATTEQRVRIVTCLRRRHGRTATLRRLDLASWNRHLLGGLLTPPTPQDESLIKHMEWLVTAGVTVPYVAQLMQSGTRTKAFLTLKDALELRRGEDPELLMEEHLAWAILDHLVPEQDVAGHEDGPASPFLPLRPA